MMMKKLRSKVGLSERAVSRGPEPWRFWLAVATICGFLLPFICFMNFHHPFSILNFEPSVRLSLQMQMVQDGSGDIAETGIDMRTVTFPAREIGNGEANSTTTRTEETLINKGNNAQESTLFCDTSQYRFDACVLTGDVRVESNSSRIIAVSALETSNTIWKIRPYPRKWEAPLMARIKNLSVSSSTSHPNRTPICSINHTTPAVVFSTGGFSGNFFHDLTDILIPLYVTSHRFHHEVRFLVTDFSYGFINKYKPMLIRLSKYELINLDSDTSVHCFPEVHVGLINNKELGIDTTKPPFGPSMDGFRDLLRSSFSLKRKSITKKGGKKPRLLIQLRKGSRELINSKEVVLLAKRLGFKVVTAGPEETKNITSYSALVNSVDALLGVHGAGLANIVFLPVGAPMIQIIPWGELKWACRFSYGDPAIGMGLRYFEYEIKAEESSLIEQYPRNDVVFTNPVEIHKQGWNMLWYVFLEKQKVKVDLKRFRSVLAEVLQYLK